MKKNSLLRIMGALALFLLVVIMAGAFDFSSFTSIQNCSTLNSPWLRAACLRFFLENKSGGCLNLLANDSLRDFCFSLDAGVNNNPAVCDSVVNDSMKTYCLESISSYKLPTTTVTVVSSTIPPVPVSKGPSMYVYLAIILFLILLIALFFMSRRGRLKPEAPADGGL